MQAQQRMHGTTRQRHRTLLAALLAAYALAILAPAATSKPAVPGSGDRGARTDRQAASGQDVRAAAAAPIAGQAAPVEPATKAAPATASSAAPAGAKASHGSTTSKPALPAHASSRAQEIRASTTPAGQADPGQNPSAGATQQASAQAPAASSTQAAVPVAAPITQAAPAAPAAQPTRAIADAANVSSAPARRASTSKAAAERPRRTTAARTPATATTAHAATPSSSAEPRRARDAARPTGATVPSRLTRTVVRVLEVIPPWVRVALLLAACLGALLAAAAAVQTMRHRRLARQRQRLVADVGLLQSALLPALSERIGGARVTAAYRPAEGLAAGGDFYDAFALPGGRTAVLVGDIAGHGREVVPLTALVRYSLRAYLEAGLSPRSTLHVAGNVLATQLGGRQVTVAVAIFDPGSGRMTYACAGHAPPLLLNSTATPVTACSSPPIGADAPTGRRQTTIALAPGAAACFHTDGLDEAPVAAGRLGRDGVGDELRAVGADGHADELIARVVRRSVRLPDDMAVCMITALPGGADGWSLQLEELELDAHALQRGSAERFLVACGGGGPQLAKAHHEARAVIARYGTAVIEVRGGEAVAEVRVRAPSAVTLPIGRSAGRSNELAATG